MASRSFWARGDSTTANNNELNPIGTTGGQGVPAFQLIFHDDDPDVPGIDTTGDLSLDGFVVGVRDPDTMVQIGGVRYPFIFIVQGVLPVSGQQGAQQVPPVHYGDAVGVIRVTIAGQPREYFFILDGSGTQASMNAFGAGAVGLTSIDFTPCFCAGTRIKTQSGPRLVETLVAGDWVLTANETARQIIWVGVTRVPRASLVWNQNLRPVVIPADTFSPGVPDGELRVSPQHRILIEDPGCELLFGEPAVLVAAKYIVGRGGKLAEPTGDVEYYHVLLEDHDMLISNGLVSESFQPARRTMDVMDHATRTRLEDVLAVLGANDMLARKDSYLSLKEHEAAVLLDRYGVTAPRIYAAEVGLQNRAVTR